MKENSAFHGLSTKQLRALKKNAEKAERASGKVKKPSKKELITDMERKYDLHETKDGFSLFRKDDNSGQSAAPTPTVAKAATGPKPTGGAKSQEEMIAAIYRKLNN